MEQKSLSIASLFTGVVFGVLVLFTPAAHAITLDFVAEAAGNERGVADGTIINFDGLNVTFTAQGGSAYFDDLRKGKPGGLGVCTKLTSSAQCEHGHDSDDSEHESVTLGFSDGSVDFSGLSFTNKKHKSVKGSDTLLIGLNGGKLNEFTFSDAIASVFLGVSEITFAYGGDEEKEFYLNSANAVAVVPLPAALPLFGAGLAFMAFIGGYKKHKANAATA